MTTELSNLQLDANSLVVLIKFLANLNDMRRISDIEVQAIKPAFDEVSAFLSERERMLTAQQEQAQRDRNHYDELERLRDEQEQTRILKENSVKAAVKTPTPTRTRQPRKKA